MKHGHLYIIKGQVFTFNSDAECSVLVIEHDIFYEPRTDRIYLYRYVTSVTPVHGFTLTAKEASGQEVTFATDAIMRPPFWDHERNEMIVTDVKSYQACKIKGDSPMFKRMQYVGNLEGVTVA